MGRPTPREPRPIIHKILEQSCSATAPGKAGTNLHRSAGKPFPPRAGIRQACLVFPNRLFLAMDRSRGHLRASKQPSFQRDASNHGVLLCRLFLAMDRSRGPLRASKQPSFRREASNRGVLLCRLFLAMDRSRGPLRGPIPGGMPSNPNPLFWHLLAPPSRHGQVERPFGWYQTLAIVLRF